MLGQNMFPKAPPSGYTVTYQPQLQANLNKQKFDQLISLMQQQEQTVGDYNMKMKEREDQLYQLEEQSQQLQKELISQDKARKLHNSIPYKNYLPGFNVKPTTPIQQITEEAQSLHSQKYQQYNQGIQSEEQQQLSMSQNPRRASVQSINQRPQSNPRNPKLMQIQKQIEDQNQYIQQLTTLIGTKKPPSAQGNEDSLQQLLNQREELQKQQLLNEVQQLRQRVQGFENRQYPQQQPYMPQQMMMQQGLQMPYQQYPLQQYPQMMMPPLNQNQEINQDEEESDDDDDLTKQLMMKLMAQQTEGKNTKNGHHHKGAKQNKHQQRTPKNHQNRRRSSVPLDKDDIPDDNSEPQ